MNDEREPNADEAAGMFWWNGLDEHQRRKWMEAAGNTGVAADAWAAFKRIAPTMDVPPNPVGAGPRAERIGAMASEYISATRALINELTAEANALCGTGGPFPHEQAEATIKDLAYVSAIVSASHRSLTDAWTQITSTESGLSDAAYRRRV
jgi:hypothetical protein